MKRVLVAVAVLGAVSSTAVGQARDEPLATRPGLELGLQAAHYQYEEPGFMKLSGNRGGITGAYTFTSPQRVFSRIDIRGSYGRLKFQGASGTSANIPDLIVESRAVAGIDFPVNEHLWLSPYAGFGLRYLYDDLRGYNTANVAVGYRRESTYAYAPLGVAVRVRLGEHRVLVPSLEADAFIRGKQTTRLSDLGTGTSDVMNGQNRGRGYRGSLMLEQDRWAICAWMHYWRVRDSDAQAGGVYVPENRTRESGLEIRYRF
jgi:hypothetical protein